MIIINYILILFVGVILGSLLNKFSNKLSEKLSHNKIILDKNKQYKQILEKVNTKRSRFKTRINDAIYIGVKLEDFGKVDVVFFLDKNDVVIFKNEKCIMTSDYVDKELLKKIMDDIYRVHSHRIDDVIQILGLTFSRQDFENSFGISAQELKQRTEGMMRSMNYNEDQSDIDKIINKNKRKLDINEILDRINEVGIENLTEEEKDFLNNYKND